MRAGVLIAIAAAACLGFLAGHRCRRIEPVEPPTIKADTLFIRDTSSFTEPKYEPSPEVLVKEIPVPVYVADSSAIDSLLNECARLERVGDSLKLVLLRVQRHYSDSTFDAWVSGVDPRLDSIKTYQTNMVITKEIPVIRVKRTRWGLGVQAGMGACKDGLTPYVGVGVSYNLFGGEIQSKGRIYFKEKTTQYEQLCEPQGNNQRQHPDKRQ